MENKFLTFIRPYLSYIDDGHFFRKLFSWLYILLAVVNLLIPIYLLSWAVIGGITSMLLWVIIAFTGWVSFQLWWNRRSKINMYSITGDDFVATPVFSHFIQTLGEWLGIHIGLVGFGFALTGRVFGRVFFIELFEEENPYFLTGWVGVITMPIIGFLIIVFFRYLSERMRALASIANNTKKQQTSP
jgi:hypothetical protein